MAAVLPAALAGHGFAYAIAGRSADDARHAWMAPAMECSLALLLALVLLAAGNALLRVRALRHTAEERSFSALWPRLAASQIALFLLIESLEGAHVGARGILIQVLVAIFAAWMLTLFARLLGRLRCYGERAGRYLERLHETPFAFVPRLATPPAYALAVRAGTARFQRPPPHR